MSTPTVPASHDYPRNMLTSQQQAGLLWHLRFSLATRNVRRMAAASRLRLTLIVLLSAFFWGGLFWLFYDGFKFLENLHSAIIQSLYNAIFASLMIMLTFSSAIILYGALYTSQEARYLLTTPIRPERIFAYKFQEALWFSSWGFILLGSPMVVAHGVVSGATWYYYLLLLPFMVSFVYIPASIGAMLCLLVIHWLSQVRVHALGIVTAVFLVASVWGALSIARTTKNDVLTPVWFQEISARLHFTEQQLLPSWWLSSGLLDAAIPYSAQSEGRPEWAVSLMFLTLLVSNALFFRLIACWVASRYYRSGYGRLISERASHRRGGLFWLDRVLWNAMFPLPMSVRLLLLKDFRVFRRDPMQWSQFLIFFGLLALYFFNIQRFRYNTAYLAMIGFLNLAVVGLILSTFTTRFVFPSISLEGQRFWIVGLLPIRRDVILWSKFVFAAVGSIIPSCLLIYLSDAMLDITPLVRIVHQIACIIICLGLSGIAVGLGPQLPDLREDSPSKIAAGFGGTLNLVVSALYIAVIVILTAVPCHIHLASPPLPTNETLANLFDFLGSKQGIFAGVMAAFVVGLLTTLIPMRSGFRAFRKLEF